MKWGVYMWYSVNLETLNYGCFLKYRVIGDKLTEEFYDPEWDFCERFCGKPKTWWVYTGYGKFIKMYSPALADCVRERTGWIIEPFGHEEME